MESSDIADYEITRQLADCCKYTDSLLSKAGLVSVDLATLRSGYDLPVLCKSWNSPTDTVTIGHSLQLIPSEKFQLFILVSIPLRLMVHHRVCEQHPNAFEWVTCLELFQCKINYRLVVQQKAPGIEKMNSLGTVWNARNCAKWSGECLENV